MKGGRGKGEMDNPIFKSRGFNQDVLNFGAQAISIQLFLCFPHLKKEA
jgi:hypothetical protein